MASLIASHAALWSSAKSHIKHIKAHSRQLVCVRMTINEPKRIANVALTVGDDHLASEPPIA